MIRYQKPLDLLRYVLGSSSLRPKQDSNFVFFQGYFSFIHNLKKNREIIKIQQVIFNQIKNKIERVGRSQLLIENKRYYSFYQAIFNHQKIRFVMISNIKVETTLIILVLGLLLSGFDLYNYENDLQLLYINIMESLILFLLIATIYIYKEVINDQFTNIQNSKPTVESRILQKLDSILIINFLVFNIKEIEIIFQMIQVDKSNLVMTRTLVFSLKNLMFYGINKNVFFKYGSLLSITLYFLIHGVISNSIELQMIHVISYLFLVHSIILLSNLKNKQENQLDNSKQNESIEQVKIEKKQSLQQQFKSKINLLDQRQSSRNNVINQNEVLLNEKYTPRSIIAKESSIHQSQPEYIEIQVNSNIQEFQLNNQEYSPLYQNAPQSNQPQTEEPKRRLTEQFENQLGQIYQEILNTIPYGMALINLNEQIIFSNRQILFLLGIKKKESIIETLYRLINRKINSNGILSSHIHKLDHSVISEKLDRSVKQSLGKSNANLTSNIGNGIPHVFQGVSESMFHSGFTNSPRINNIRHDMTFLHQSSQSYSNNSSDLNFEALFLNAANIDQNGVPVTGFEQQFKFSTNEDDNFRFPDLIKSKEGVLGNVGGGGTLKKIINAVPDNFQTVHSSPLLKKQQFRKGSMNSNNEEQKKNLNENLFNSIQFNNSNPNNIQSSLVDSNATLKQQKFFRQECLIDDIETKKTLKISLLEIQANHFINDKAEPNEKSLFLYFFVEDITEQMKSQRAKREMIAKYRMMGTISHNFRTPLNCSINMLSFAEKICSNDVKMKFLKPALSSNFLLLNMINNMIDFVAIESQKFQINKTCFKFSDVIRQTLEILKVKSEMQNIRIQLISNLDRDLEIMNDFRVIEQILINLLDNSIKFTQNHGLIQIIVTPIFFYQTIQIEVQDDGIGIKQEDLEIIRNDRQSSFIQEEGRSQARVNSIGVSICQQLVTFISERRPAMEIDSQYGKGTCVSFYIDCNMRQTFRIHNNSSPNKNMEHINEQEEEMASPQSKKQQNGKKQSIINAFNIDEEQKSENVTEQASQTSRQTVQSLIVSRRDTFKLKPHHPVIDHLVSFGNIALQGSDNQLPQFEIENSSSGGSVSFMEKKKNQYRENQRQSQISVSNIGLSDSLKISIEGHLQQNSICQIHTQILLVDDDEFNLLTLQEMIGFINSAILVQTAYDGFDAVQKVQEKAISPCQHEECRYYQLILMDIDMPQKNGFQTTHQIFQLLKELNQEESTKTIIIACSAFDSIAERKKGTQVGMADYLSQPVDFNVLQGKIAAIFKFQTQDLASKMDVSSQNSQNSLN